MEEGPFCEPVLAFIKAFRLRGDAATLKQAALSRFSTAMLSDAKRALWEVCSDALSSLDLSFMSRRRSEKRSQAAADLEDILEAFSRLDDVDKVPLIYCEATELVKLPPISPDSTSELVMVNGARLAEIENKVSELQEGVAELKSKVNSNLSSVPVTVPQESFATVVKTSVQANAPLPNRDISNKERSNNLVVFGLPEVGSLQELKSSVDELLQFLVGKQVDLNDLFRLGRKSATPSESDRPRPVLLKLTSSWDRRLIMSTVRKLKEYDHKRVFIREDLSLEARQKRREIYLARKAGEPESSRDLSDPTGTLPENSAASTGPSSKQ